MPERSSKRAHDQAFWGFVAVLVAIGLGARASGFTSEERLFQQFPTEDGYLMLTISRNLAISNGFSVGAGEIPTNGTQPLATFIYAIGFLLSGGGRAGGVAFALVLQLLFAGIAAWLIFRLGARVFSRHGQGEKIAALAGSLWFASGINVAHSMNCLETGLYALVSTSVALVFVETEDAPLWSWSKCLAVGALLGVAFWTRNDACFLILAACLVHLYVGADRGLADVRARFGRTLVFGSTSVVLATPWLAYNYLGFGHLMPVSGRAESLNAHLGENFPAMVVALAEYCIMVVGIPGPVEKTAWMVALITVFVLIVVGVLAFSFRRASTMERRLAVFAGIFVGCIAIFYGFFFGAGWFLSRYLFPVSPFLFLFGARLTFWVLERVPASTAQASLRWVGSAVAIGLISLMNGRTWVRGTDHMHFQVVEWVRENVDDETWVGAVQTGTLGFFHDRTINLDGKVNPAAFEALKKGRTGEYIVGETPIRFLADWASYAEAISKDPVLSPHFEVVVLDHTEDLGVARRTTPLAVESFDSQ